MTRSSAAKASLMSSDRKDESAHYLDELAHCFFVQTLGGVLMYQLTPFLDIALFCENCKACSGAHRPGTDDRDVVKVGFGIAQKGVAAETSLYKVSR